jgi:hypothetical protein
MRIRLAPLRSSVVCGGLLLTFGCAAPQHGFVFAVAADMREFTPPQHAGPAYFAGVCDALHAVGPGAFMISPGDIDPPDRVRATLDQAFGAEYAWYAVVGNHEGEQPQTLEYLRTLNAGGRTLPRIMRGGPPGALETCYAFDYGRAHFVVLNEYYDGKGDMANDGDVSDPLYRWLAEDLAANRQPIVFVCGHEPTVAIPDMDNGLVRHRGDSLDAHEANNRRFWALLQQYQVTAYICGHSHCTSLAKINGVWQIDAGHARGHGDESTASTFLTVHVLPTGIRCDVYRLIDQDGHYTLQHSVWLN